MSSTATNPSLTPATTAPPSSTSNLNDPSSKGSTIIIAMVTFLTLATPAIFARIYTRYYVNHELWWDDYAAVIGWIGLVGSAAILLEALNYGAEIDEWNVSTTDIAHFNKLNADIEIVARISVSFVKLSILLLYLRVFAPPKTQRTRIYYSIWIVIWFNLLYCIATVLTVLLQCVNKTHDAGAACIDTYVFSLTASSFNVLTDLMMLAIPLLAVWNLQMPMTQKVKLSVVFAVGFLAVATSIARLGWQIKYVKDPNETVVLAGAAILAYVLPMEKYILLVVPVLTASQYRRTSCGHLNWLHARFSDSVSPFVQAKV
ncbi:hypothetical protein MMC25_005761 [Agyrium rufum]|nr:hypothetical protein [Agyrium rufum]